RRWFNVLPLPEAVTRVKEGRLPARPLSITFDDGYADNHAIALPILRRLGLHATFFIASSFLDGGRMWNDTIIEAIRAHRDGVLDLADLDLGNHPLGTVEERRAAINKILGKLKYFETERRTSATEGVARRVGAALPHDLMMTSSQVADLHYQG